MSNTCGPRGYGSAGILRDEAAITAVNICLSFWQLCSEKSSCSQFCQLEPRSYENFCQNFSDPLSKIWKANHITAEARERTVLGPLYPCRGMFLFWDLGTCCHLCLWSCFTKWSLFHVSFLFNFLFSVVDTLLLLFLNLLVSRCHSLHFPLPFEAFSYTNMYMHVITSSQVSSVSCVIFLGNFSLGLAVLKASVSCKALACLPLPVWSL